MAIRATNIIIIYFVLGAVMFGGGAVSWDDSGPTKYFVDKTGDKVSPNEENEESLTGVDKAITSLIGTFGGPVLLVWNLFVGFVSAIHWPLFVLMDNGAPPRVTILLGGTLTGMFYAASIRLVKSSA